MHHLVRTLSSPSVEQDGTRVFPLMAIQVTVFPNSGFAICLTFNHVVADGKSLHHFIKFWASICKARGDMASLETSMPLPSYERDRVKDPKDVKLLYSRVFAIREPKRTEFKGLTDRFTIVLSGEETDKLKKWVSFKCGINDSGALHISTFVVTCSLIWVCMVGSEESKEDSGELCYFVFLADSRDRPELSLTSTYFGNCLASCIVAIKRSEIVGENGMVVVANGIEREIRDFKTDALRKIGGILGSETRELWKPGNSMLVVAGSPKFGVYQTDFGWGKPKKCEAVHESSGSFSLSDCRDEEGKIEVGLTLERTQMNKFMNILEDQLNNIDI